MQTTSFQPYRVFEPAFLGKLAIQGNFYLVSQSYSRGEHAADHTKTPILFSPYKQLNEAGLHFRVLQEGHAAIVDIRTPKIAARMADICSGKTNVLPYIALVENIAAVNNYIDHHLYEQMRSWVRRNKPLWNIREPNSLQPFFETVRGEPVIKIKWGTRHVVVKLDELENM